MFKFDATGNIISSSPPATVLASPPGSPVPLGTQAIVPTLAGSPVSAAGSSFGSPISNFSNVSVGSWQSTNESPVLTGLAGLTLNDRMNNPWFAQEFQLAEQKEVIKSQIKDAMFNFDVGIDRIVSITRSLLAQGNFLGDQPKLLVALQPIKNDEIPRLVAEYQKFLTLVDQLYSLDEEEGSDWVEDEIKVGEKKEHFKTGMLRVHQTLYDTFSGLTNANTPRVVDELNQIFTLLMQYEAPAVEIEMERKLNIDEDVLHDMVEEYNRQGYPRDQIVQKLIQEFNIDPTIAGYLVDLA